MDVYRFIVVEDEAALAELLIRLIRRRYPEAEIETFWDGQEALDAYDRAGADLLLVDRGVARVDGLTLTRTLRARGDRVPIIGMSGDPHVREQYLAAGATAFVSGRELFDTVVGLIERALAPPGP